MSEPVVLKGLDGSNPFAFLAALGVLKAISGEVTPDEQHNYKLSWIENGRWYPAIYGMLSVDSVVEAIMCDKLAWEEDPSFCLSYTKNGSAAPFGARDSIRDLKPPPDLMKLYLETIAELASKGIKAPAEMAAAFGSEMVVDGNGNTKPTAFHFTAGMQTFLKMVCELWAGLTATDIVEAISGPWQRKSKLPSFSWDATDARIYALRASDPAKEKRGSTPGSEWLAFLGLSYFPVAPIGDKLLTTGVKGGWKDSSFTWPIWNVPATIDGIRSIVSIKNLAGLSSEERRAYGICELYASRINRSDQGGYGSFSPSRVV